MLIVHYFMFYLLTHILIREICISNYCYCVPKADGFGWIFLTMEVVVL